MPELPVQANAGNARRFTIPANDKETTIDVILPNDKEPGNYIIVKKDIPSEAKGQKFRGATVKWLNNFGVRLKGKFKTKKNVEADNPFIEEVDGQAFSYQVVVPGPAPEGYSTVVYFDGKDVQLGASAPDSDGNYRFSLDIGDPAAGWGG